MDVTTIASQVMAQQRTADAITIAVMKKRLEIEASGTMALINALPQPAAANNPPNLGNNIDTTA